MNELIFEMKEEQKKPNYGKFVISPLEQGYGATLGNSLRRVLLTSLPGSAITSVKISGVKHQFSTLKGMKEDVVDFVLNLKLARFRYLGDKPVKLTLSVKSPGEVKVKDIKVPASVEIANPELVLAVLNKGAKIEAEIELSVGSGYSLAEEGTIREIGLIPVDASFSPVTRVNYKVEETRVGRLTNFDKLILEIWTDGTISAKEALTNAAKILVQFFSQIVSPKTVKMHKNQKLEDFGPAGKLSVEEIGLPTRVSNALDKAGYSTVEDLAKADKTELVKVRNLGEKSLKIIAVALKEKGVDF